MYTIQTLAHKNDDTSHPLIMLTNKEGYKYFFGKIPEGTQRVLNENRVRLGSLKSVFLTGILSSWSDIGGLPGFFLTLSDSTKKGIDVFTNSSPILSYIVATWRTFVFRKGVELKILETNAVTGIIGDNNISVKPVLIASEQYSLVKAFVSNLAVQVQKLVSLMFPMDTSSANDRSPFSYKSDPSETDLHTHVQLPSPDQLVPPQHQKSANYIVRFLPIRGKFDPAKAKQLGLKPGVNYRKLSQGEPVENEDGVTIYPEQVVDPSRPLPKVLVLDIPNLTYLKPTIDSPEWFICDENTGPEQIGLVYHMLGDEIDYQSPEYQQFMLKFPADCKHVISHSNIANNTLVFKRLAVNVLTLKSVQNRHFNLPRFEQFEPLALNDNVFKLQQLQTFNVSNTGVISSNADVRTDTYDTLFNENIVKLELDVDKNDIINDSRVSLDFEATKLKDQVHIITLGTGSAIPSLYRNVISTLVRVPYKDSNGNLSVRSILLDGGENTLGTILRNFGSDSELRQVFQELSLIHLSHLHADHHLGIISVINKWFELNQDTSRKLYMVVPWQFRNFVTEWYDLEGAFNPLVDIDRLVLISCEEFIRDRAPEYEPLTMDEFERRFDCHEYGRVIPKKPLQPRNTKLINQFFADLNIKSLQTVRALHCAWAYSISIDVKLSEDETFKVSYSGDTRPNPAFVEIGYGSDLLIHESTLDNDLIEEALAKKHSTMIEAISMAKYMNCPKVILTHFSTRYSNKSYISLDTGKLETLARELNEYMETYSSGTGQNIFSLERMQRPTKSYDELEICFAFDMMNIRYGEVDCQKSCQDIVGRVFAVREVNDEKKEKEIQKQNEKREAKRTQRLSYTQPKKRKTP